jgi:hypothetical protein
LLRPTEEVLQPHRSLLLLLVAMQMVLLLPELVHWH